MIPPLPYDRRCLRPKQVVRVLEDAPSPYRGMLLILSAVGDEFVTGVVRVLSEDPVVVSLPRMYVSGRVSSGKESHSDDPDQSPDPAR